MGSALDREFQSCTGRLIHNTKSESLVCSLIVDIRLYAAVDGHSSARKDAAEYLFSGVLRECYMVSKL